MDERSTDLWAGISHKSAHPNQFQIKFPPDLLNNLNKGFPA